MIDNTPEAGDSRHRHVHLRTITPPNSGPLLSRKRQKSPLFAAAAVDTNAEMCIDGERKEREREREREGVTGGNVDTGGVE